MLLLYFISLLQLARAWHGYEEIRRLHISISLYQDAISMEPLTRSCKQGLRWNGAQAPKTV